MLQPNASGERTRLLPVPPSYNAELAGLSSGYVGVSTHGRGSARCDRVGEGSERISGLAMKGYMWQLGAVARADSHVSRYRRSDAWT
jgi:hypothetical protein